MKTEDFVPSLPPKTITENVDWFTILDSFDPAALEEKYLQECADRNPYETGRHTAPEPIEKRMEYSQLAKKYNRQKLEAAVKKIEKDGLTPVTYKNARAVLIKCIGQKGAAEYIRREFESLDEAGRKRQAEEHAIYMENMRAKMARQEKLYDLATMDPYFLDNVDEYELDQAELEELDEMIEEGNRASLHAKVIRVRKGFKGSNGKPFTQKDFAALIEYPFHKYAEAERDVTWSRKPDSPVEFRLLEKLVMICHANPYWLFDCEESMAQEDASLFVQPDVILKWIKEGKPRNLSWQTK